MQAANLRLPTVETTVVISTGNKACFGHNVPFIPVSALMSKETKNPSYPFASGGWGSLKSVATILLQEKVPLKDSAILLRQNKADGFMCVSCSWAKPADPHTFEFCESGAKATAWDTTAKRMTPEFFEMHTVKQLLNWHDHDLKKQDD
ncbi:protein of unknown function (plasmid) [Caballeronia sp. S22]